MSTGDYAKAVWLPSPNFWPGGDGNQLIVIHATASGGPQTGYQLATSAEFTDSQSKSVHYINDVDGVVYQIVHEADSAWGNCCVDGNSPFSTSYNWNRNTISIENVKHSSDNSEPLTAAQYQSLLALVRDIARRQNIPLVHGSPTTKGIIYHKDLMPIQKANDPGTFPYDTFFSDLQKGVMPLVELPNFPRLSQQTTITSDQQYSENAADDCVYASIGMCIQYFRKKTTWDTTKEEGGVNPDNIKDIAQGQGYTGGGNAALAIPFCAKFGLDLVQLKGTNAELVAAMHANLKAGYPSILTIVSIYDPAWWHVLACFKEISGGLGAVDPYPLPSGVVQEKSDADWISKLQGGSIWVIKPKGAIMGLPTGAKDDGAAIHFANTPLVITKGYRDLYNKLAATNQIPPDDMPISNEYGVGPVEQSNPVFWGGPGTAQETRYFRFGWSPKVGAKRTYIGQELRWYMQSLAAVQNENADLKVKLAALQAIINAGGPGIPQAVKDDITSLASHIAPTVTIFGQLVRDAGLTVPPTGEKKETK